MIKKSMLYAGAGLFLMGVLAFWPGTAYGQADPDPKAEHKEENKGLVIKFPTIESGASKTEIVTVLEILALVTLLTLAPSIIMMTTSFTRMVIVFSFLRRALAVQSLPSNQVIVGMSLFMTLMIMWGPDGEGPWGKAWSDGLQPYLEGREDRRTVEQLRDHTLPHLRKWMFKQVAGNDSRYQDLWMLVNVTKMHVPEAGLKHKDITLPMLTSAFILGELKRAFEMGFFIYLPFLVVDMVVASILMSMGMMMLPPPMISLPFKLMLFVLGNGWSLVVLSLFESFGTPVGLL